MADIGQINPTAMAPPGGHYSHAVTAGGMVFVSGQLPIAPDGTKLNDAPFETQARQVLDNVALALARAEGKPPRAIAEIIHDIDLKDSKFGRTEVAGIRTLIEGISVTTKDDPERIARGSEVFNDLYEYFKKKRR